MPDASRRGESTPVDQTQELSQAQAAEAQDNGKVNALARTRSPLIARQGSAIGTPAPFSFKVGDGGGKHKDK